MEPTISKEINSYWWRRYREDALTNEDVDKCGLISPKKANEDPAFLKKEVLGEIFKRMHDLVDRQIYFDFQKVLTSITEFTFRPVAVHHVRSYHTKTFAYAQEDREQSIRTFEVVNNIWKALVHLFGGWRLNESYRAIRMLEKSFFELKSDANIWMHSLKTHDTHKELHQVMMNVFIQAEQLLKKRHVFIQDICYQRVTLYVSALLTCLGKILNQQVLTAIGLASSSMTLIFMLSHYGTSSIKLARLAADLKVSIEKVKNMASAPTSK